MNKTIREFPEEINLSTPESALAAADRCQARADIHQLLDLSWTKLPPKAVTDISNQTKNAMAFDGDLGKKILDTRIVEVLTYREDLAAVITTGNLYPTGYRPFAVQHLARIDGTWKILDLRKGWYFSKSLEKAEERFAAEKDEIWRRFDKVRNEITHWRLPAAEADERRKLQSTPMLSDKHKEFIEQTQAKTWVMAPRLDVPAEEVPAVQFAILDHDPGPGYVAQLKRMRAHTRRQSENADTEFWKASQRNAAIQVSWNKGFEGITGDRLYLLMTTSGTTISSNSRDGKKWVVTKVVRVDGQPTCWCIPVEVKIGDRVDVTLSMDNMFDLNKSYDEVINALVVGSEEEVTD